MILIGMVRCGIAGWIDKSLIESKAFYPPDATSAEERLRFYASQFPLVEVDSTYYGMPRRENSELWVARTPEGFRFDVKAFSLFTQHPMQPKALPKEIREGLPKELLEKKNVYLEQVPPDVVDQAWEAFRDALEPLRAGGRLGAVFFQFPPWFYPSRRALTYIEQVQERMFGFDVAVEFRKRDWLDEDHRAGTLEFLRLRGIPFVAVDAPQEAGQSAMPGIAEATSEKYAFIRFHGRNRETWNIKGAPPNLRFRWDYQDEELAEWVPKIQALEEHVQEVHAIMNNNYSNWSVKNAHQLEKLLEEANLKVAPPPA
jgi:uncharacterized protein YecE (DUF72 family)